MVIKRMILKWIIITLMAIITVNFNLNRILQFIIIFIEIAGTFFLVDYFLPKKS